MSVMPDITPVPFDPSVEHVDAKEAEIDSEIDTSMTKIREKTFANGGHTLRSVHAKLQGVLRATLIVEAGLPQSLAQGLFAEPGRYDAVMRFSTIPGDILDDKVSVPRGGGKSAKLVSVGGHAPTHVLGASYYTAAALRHGAYIAKLAFVPMSPELQALKDQKVELDDRPDGLREEVVAFMRNHRAEWAVQVQLCTDLEKMPVEDASVPWPEELSPYVTVARLVAEPQQAYSEALARAVDDGLFFSPWRGLAAHRPLGNVMRARKPAYERSAQFRAARNGHPVVEPSDLSALAG